MWSWTACVSQLEPFHTSEDGKTKVYEVTTQNPMNREVIAKRVECENEESAARAMEEGRIAKANPHPNICECLHFLTELKQEGGFYVYVITPKMQKSFQQEIEERIRARTPFPEEELLKLTRQLIAAYAFLQDKVTFTQNIAHRDIKPQNILLDANGDVKVCDFGFAKSINLSGPAMHTLLGTVPYFSPALRAALISGEKDISRVEHNVFKSDVYSLGICLAFATTFEIPDFITTLHRLQENISTRLHKVKKYSESWVNLLRNMLSVDEVWRPDFRSLEHPLPYADDEPFSIVPKEAEEESPLELTVKCGLSHVRVSPTLCEQVPCMISLRSRAVEAGKACYFTDIVAVIDVSGSMAGSRIGMVQQTLAKLVELLNENDRLAIVSFNDNAVRNCALTRCSVAGKETLRSVINGLRASGRTNISEGFVMGMDILEQRRGRNGGSTILLFSDGQDTQKLPPLPICLEKYHSRSDSKVTIHVFGYGEDLDAQLLETLSSEGKGSFHHITEIPLIETAFGLALGDITSVVARNLQVNVSVRPGPVKCKIPLIFSKDGAGSFSLPDISANQQKDFIFMLEAERKQLAKTSSFEPVSVTVDFQDNEGGDFQKSVNMNVKFVPWADAVPPRDSQVFMNWYRVKGAYCMRDARQFAENKQFKEADLCLAFGIELLQSGGFGEHEYIAPLIRDLQEARALVQNDQTWQRGGDAHFASVSYSHYSQSPSVHAMHYSSEQQQRSVKEISQMQVPPP